MQEAYHSGFKRPTSLPKFEFPLFDLDVYLAFDYESLKKGVKSEEIFNFIDESKAGFSTFSQDEAGIFALVYITSPKDKGLIAHELSHVIFEILGMVGIDARNDGGEIFCYMLQHFYYEVEKLLANAKKPPHIDKKKLKR